MVVLIATIVEIEIFLSAIAITVIATIIKIAMIAEQSDSHMIAMMAGRILQRS